VWLIRRIGQLCRLGVIFRLYAAIRRVCDSFRAALDWLETNATALAFILDHAPEDDNARQAAEALIAQGLRKALACPAPS